MERSIKRVQSLVSFIFWGIVLMITSSCVNDSSPTSYERYKYWYQSGDTIFYSLTATSPSNDTLTTILMVSKSSKKTISAIFKSQQGAYVHWWTSKPDHFVYDIRFINNGTDSLLNRFWFNNTVNYSYNHAPLFIIDSIYNDTDSKIAYIRYPYIPFFSRTLQIKFIDKNGFILDTLLMTKSDRNSFMFLKMPLATFSTYVRSYYLGNSGKKWIEIEGVEDIDTIAVTQILDTNNLLYHMDSLPLWR